MTGGGEANNGTILGFPLDWVEKHQAYCSLLAFACCALATIVSVYAIYGHLRHYGRPNLQKYIVRIIVIVPVYSISSWLSLQVVHHTAALYVETLRDCYEAFVVYSFLSLILTFAGGESACVAKMEHEAALSHPVPFCCLTPVARDGRLLRNCKRAALQFVVVKPTFAVVSLIMLACGNYDSHIYQWILTVVYNMSYSVALYGLLLFYLATKHVLYSFKPVRKFLAVKVIVFLTFWQTSLIGILPGITRYQAIAWKEFVLCVEMPLFAILLYCAFSPSEFQQQFERMPESDVLKNMKEVLSVTDIVADAYHNFMPSYQEYILQRSDDEFPEKYRARTFIVGNIDQPTIIEESDVEYVDDSTEKQESKTSITASATIDSEPTTD